MAMDFASLLQRKLLFVTGKGGAGKSMLSLALAHRLSAAGKRVWLVEVGRKRDVEFTRLPGLLGKKTLSHAPEEVTFPGTRLRLHASVLNPTQSLAEYVDLKLPTAGFASLLLNNRVTASLLEVVPGLPDLVSLGKIWHSLAHRSGPAPDVVVLDAPASGHAVALLKAPANFQRITRVGPIHKDATQIVEFLADPARTGIVLASLPEEMSVQETLDLRRWLSGPFPAPFVFVNKCFPSLPELEGMEGQSPVWKAYRYAFRRAEREHAAVAELAGQGAQLVPFFFPEPGAQPLYLRLSEALG